MKVRELIEQLSKLDREEEVRLSVEGAPSGRNILAIQRIPGLDEDDPITVHLCSYPENSYGRLKADTIDIY